MPDAFASIRRRIAASPRSQLAVRRARDAATHARAFGRLGADARRGARYGRLLAGRPAPDAPPSPRGRLEEYFDANLEGPGLWKWRHYFPVYERHLARFVGRAPLVVEVGIFSGGSLPMWLDYFGEGTRVHGIDIEPACRAHESAAVSVSIGDQADPRFWARFLDGMPPIDIVIDDGGHRAAQQIATLEAVLPHLRPGGVYLCEDVHGPQHPFHAYIDGLGRNLHAVGTGSMDEGYEATAFQRAVASIHRYPFLVVIETHDADLARLIAPKHGTRWEPSSYASQSFPRAGES